MSSIRLFILGSLAQRGEMHGHQLRLLAEEEHVHLWTDISVGGLYGALKRLHAEGLIADIRTEQAGNFPARVVYGITDTGRSALEQLRSDALSHFALRPDPFDLGLTRLDPARLDVLPDVIAARVALLKQHLVDAETANAGAQPYLSVAEKFALAHREARLRAEIDWHENLVAALPDIVADERTREIPPLPNTKDGCTT
ncbi:MULTISPECIES: PadR family transcriptional regulator [unclassified Rhodococcus (in: high G+C Gram-positive bacteria)]|uniref:PadR family transcriptional regulator n=1 Tax=unclassified Rhodococcus (in: high G+C Gram-positive bacteria) TaxID=192944 RepID=UPI0027DF31C2|nr:MULTISPECIES: PadR family transcriptional regulator [unclassified Rhodococcus (in: high G+C Gram-positive bacteria)]